MSPGKDLTHAMAQTVSLFLTGRSELTNPCFLTHFFCRWGLILLYFFFLLLWFKVRPHHAMRVTSRGCCLVDCHSASIRHHVEQWRPSGAELKMALCFYQYIVVKPSMNCAMLRFVILCYKVLVGVIYAMLYYTMLCKAMLHIQHSRLLELLLILSL